MNSVPNLQQLFTEYNQTYFAEQIIPSLDFILRFSNTEKFAGWFTYCPETHEDWTITVARRLKDHPRALRSTLVHEMIHMLAHQRFRETADEYYLDLLPQADQPFINKGHGAFFFSEMNRLNRLFPELGLTIISCFGDALYEVEKIPPARLLVVSINKALGKGMIYRLHENAPIDWETLQSTAHLLHDSRDISVIQVAGPLAEGFPYLRKDNLPRANMKRLSLRNFVPTLNKLRADSNTVYQLKPAQTKPYYSQRPFSQARAG